MLTALRLFLTETDEARHKNWMVVLEDIATGLRGLARVHITIEGANDPHVIPLLVIQFKGEASLARDIIKKLIAGNPSIHTDPSRRVANQIVINPVCLKPLDAKTVATKTMQLLSA